MKTVQMIAVMAFLASNIAFAAKEAEPRSRWIEREAVSVETKSEQQEAQESKAEKPVVRVFRHPGRAGF